MAVTIAQVDKHSPASRRGIRAGDRLLRINGHEIEDVLDYRFYLMEERLTLELETPKGMRTVRLHKREEDDIGLEFDTYLMDKQRSCRNKCIFCFIDQLPPGMRESLYFKDDDSRLSFLFGNYITLTNLSERDVERIIAMHISPLHMSVHTTDPELRCRVMGNRFAGDSLKWLHRFAEAGIPMDCQLVLCPGVNDGEALEKTLRDLAALGDAVQSVAAVPVGLTRYREGLAPLRMYTPQEAAAVIDCIEAFGETMLARRGDRMAYPADEFYLKAGRPIPDEAFYGEMTQLENGVGMVALLRAEFHAALDACGETPKGSRLIFATGVSFAPILRGLIDEAQERWHNLHAEVVAVENRFFGETINVTGLVTGGDLIDQLRGHDGDWLIFPDSMLRHEGDRFLDDVTPQQVEQQVGIPVRVVPVGGDALVEALLL